MNKFETDIAQALGLWDSHSKVVVAKPDRKRTGLLDEATLPTVRYRPHLHLGYTCL